jgi:transcriptional regulator with XRE-family HTH domain
MSQVSKRRPERHSDPVRVLGRGLRAQRGVHLTLRALREGIGKTQVEIRESSGIDQADISRLETRENFDEYQVSTLQRYISGLGGHLELVAAFGDKKIILTGVQAARLVDAPANPALQRTGRRPPRR